MRNEMRIFALLIAFAQTSLASEPIFEGDWNPVNFAVAVSKCRSESFLYLEKKMEPLFVNSQTQNAEMAKALLIAMTPDIEKPATEGCYCELFAYAKEHSYADFKKGKKLTKLDNGDWKAACRAKTADEIDKFRESFQDPEYKNNLMLRLQRD